MVDVKIYEGERKWETVHAVLDSADIIKFGFTLQQTEEARAWIRKRGYHLWTYGGYAAIRLEKNSYTIIGVRHSCDLLSREDGKVFLGDCICYAAVLLYRRLKRDGVIV